MDRKKFNFALLATGIMAGSLLTSCMDEGAPSRYPTPNANMIAKAPEMIAYSGEHYWGTTSGTRATNPDWQQYMKVQDKENKNWSDWDIQNDPYYPYKDNAPSKTDRGESVSQAEYDYVMEYIRTHQGGLECHLTTYFIQNVGSSYDHYKYDYHDSQNNVDRSVEFTGGNQMDFLVIGDYHISDYNASGGPRALCVNMPINAPEVSPTYHDSWGNEDNTKVNAYQFFIITLPDDPIYGENAGKTAYYLGFDYRTKKWDNGDIDYQGDGIYNDWVVKLMPGDGSIIPNPSEPEGPGTTEPENPCPQDDCEHPVHGENGCQTCYEEGRKNACANLYLEWLLQQGQGGEGEGEGEGGKPGNPGNVPVSKDEVEVNLALDKKLHDLLESHLSIHVRTATDVEVFIPVPKVYYCAADDMEIVMKHDVEFLHGGPYRTEYKIGENIVSLNVEFEDDGIRVWTDGINQEVIDYCRETYQDGITFEIWNYFNDPATGLPYIDLDQLKGYLDQATVKFLDKVPESYVNSFGRDNGKYSEQNPDGKDFHVVPDESHTGMYDEPVEGPHYNGSSNNDIYSRTE